MREPAPLGDLVKQLLTRLGVPDLSTWREVEQRWEALAGEPWASQARPVSLQDGLLVVEAESGPAVALLRYGENSLVKRLEDTLGNGVVKEVRVRPPSRR